MEFSFVTLVDLFADGDDFSWTTITRRRNLYYQKKLAIEVDEQMRASISLLTQALAIHLNDGQYLALNSSSVVLVFGRIAFASLSNSTLNNVSPAAVHLPRNLFANVTAQTLVLYRVRDDLLRRSHPQISPIVAVHHAAIGSG